MQGVIVSKILVLDTETSGITNHPTLGHPEVIELAYLPVDNVIAELWADNPSDTEDRAMWIKHKLDRYISVLRFNPEMPIHEEAFKVHGIKKKDLLGKPKSSTCSLPKEIDIIVGHNISFDHRCLGRPDVNQICTMGLAKAINKKFNLDIGSFKLDNLVVHFYGERARIAVKEYHDASTDVFKTILLLTRLVEFFPAIETFEELYKIQQLLKGKK